MSTKLLRRATILLSLIGIVVCVVLLLNFTASNPTGRRYSSEMPLRFGNDVTINEAGFDAERILSNDLNHPNNNIAPTQCGCNATEYRQTPPNRCGTCLVISDEISSYVMPDFVAESYITDSKNLRPGSRLSTAQITSFVIMAQDLDVPLWIFVPVEGIDVRPTLQTAIESTGGGVIPYFTVPGYTDPVDRAAQTGLMVALGLLVAMLVWEFLSGRTWGGIGITTPPAPDAGKHTGNVPDLVERAKRKVDDADAELDQYT